MIKCPKCGTDMPSNSNFCTECGAKLSNVSAQSKSTNSTETFTPNGSAEYNRSQGQPNFNNNRKDAQSNNQNNSRSSVDTDQMKQTAASYWKWLVNSWVRPTDTRVPSSKWFGIVSMVLEVFFLIASYYALAQRAINATNNAISSVANSLGMNSNGLSINPFGSSVELFFTLILVGAAALSAIYGINCLVYTEKENFFTFINRFAHYTNMLLIVNVLLLLFCMVSSSFGFVTFLLIASLFFYLLGTSAVILTRNANARFDKIYGVAIVGIIMVIAFTLVTIICGNMISTTLNRFIS